MRRLPQILLNVHVTDKAKAQTSQELADAVAAAEAELAETGRVFVRPSGTEPIVRVMVEAAEETRARDVAERLATVVASALA
jgi:phosphoglucosamine mutase